MTGPSREVRVFTERPRRRSRTAIDCVVGEQLQINPRVLAPYCFNDLSLVAFDLALVAASVAFTDRVITRRAASGWKRNLRLTIPVSASQWQRPAIQQSLTETLRLLTGDNWDLSLRSGSPYAKQSEQSVLRLEHRGALAMPYSEGLDSFAVARLLEADANESQHTLIRVTTGARANVDRLPGLSQIRVAIPFNMSERGNRVRLCEPSYRSRGFVYGSLAGLAVHLAGGSRVVIPESGQSTLGAALCPLGGEAVDVRSNPVFTKRLGQFLSLLFENQIAFEHPRLWNTKGESLAELSERNLADGWNLTHSCPRSVRHVRLDGASVHCGVCAACLLRRQSLLRAGLSSGEKYQWPTLSAKSLSSAVADGARPTTHDDEKHARHGALCMEDLAELASHPGALAFRQVAAELASTSEELQGTTNRLIRLAGAHATEWRTFLAAQGDESYLTRLIATAS